MVIQRQKGAINISNINRGMMQEQVAQLRDMHAVGKNPCPKVVPPTIYAKSQHLSRRFPKVGQRRYQWASQLINRGYHEMCIVRSWAH